ncbi:MAG: hypothetical protein KGL39_58665 [Patescibacteria group bacterium]|nr:hypothetical protein [Patescibacteria group bacterium]
MVAQTAGHDNLYRITTALKAEEFQAFNQIVARNNVTASAYLRAMIIDVIHEEQSKAAA